MVNSRGDSRLDAVEKANEELNERVTSLESKLDSLLAVVRAGFASLTPGTKVPPEDEASSGNRESNSVSTGNQPPSPMPTFDGTDALAWLARAEQYFLISDTAPEKRVGVAMVALAGAALPWYQLLRRRNPDLSWARFARELMKRFGGNGALDEYEAFAAVRHTGSLAEYVAAFEARLAQVPDIACHQYLGFFMAALRPEVRLQMKAAKITSYEDVVELALDIDVLASQQPPRTAPAPSHTVSQPYTGHQRRPSTTGYSSAPSPLPSTGSSRPISKRFRNISPEEYRRHIAAGTCVKCGLKFSPTHKCPPKTLNVLICDDDELPTEDLELEEELEDASKPELSVLSLHGPDTANTMKLFGHVGQQQVKIMVDSGANYCFISEQCVQQLQLRITPTSPYSVVLGDGSTRRAAGICKGVTVTMANEDFTISCYVPVALKGNPSLMRRACSTGDLRRLEDGDCGWILHSIDTTPSASPFGIDPALSAKATDQLRQLIKQFPAIMESASNLPPRRQIGHKIPLLPGTAPVSVRPYRYNHLQKDEMEKLVAEMLESGVIQPSTSPFSSPVLLVRKKDGSWRFCVDYRELNKRTVPDKYPIPVIQELLDELHGAR
ncbi:uncharacterized protein LOC121792148 [Salvia splendens]|uniref:uncharacterized protein LOC121792148 n=1 Tax=Salvia splendens TaxID=180675 RepID=UPI001C26CFBF|nr:uncharacterized protein LOC121792148 [Salvia splendens]